MDTSIFADMANQLLETLKPYQDDFERFEGRRAKIKLVNQIQNKSVVEGILNGVVNGEVFLKTKKDEKFRIPFENISSARLNPSWDELFNKKELMEEQ